MHTQDGRLSEVEADIPLSFGSVRRVRNRWQQPIELLGTAPVHHLELSLLPVSGNAKACFPDHWGPHRFERFGEIFLLPAGHRVHARSDCREQHSLTCRFDPVALADWLGHDVPWTEGRLQASLDLTHGGVRALLLRIDEETRRPGFASEALLELMAGQAAVELFRHLSAVGEPTQQGGLSPRCLRLIDERLADVSRPPSLAELSALCHLSVRQLTRGFRASRGQSIGTVLARQRIEQARRLLAEGLPIKAVAYATGFRAPSNFSTAFLRATGETPRQYQQARSARRPARTH